MASSSTPTITEVSRPAPRPTSYDPTAEELAYGALAPLTATEKVSYIRALRSMTEAQRTQERREVGARLAGLDRMRLTRTDHPDRWREAQITAEELRQANAADAVWNTAIGASFGALTGGLVGAIFKDGRRGAGVGAAAGALAPHVSATARGLARGARFILGYAGALGRRQR